MKVKASEPEAAAEVHKRRGMGEATASGGFEVKKQEMDGHGI